MYDLALKLEEVQALPASYAGIKERLYEKYGEGKHEKIEFILRTERLYKKIRSESDQEAVQTLFIGDNDTYEGILPFIQRVAREYATLERKGFAGYRFAPSDFETIFKTEALRLLHVDQTEGKEQYTFYERLCNSFRPRAFDLARECKKKSNRIIQEAREEKAIDDFDRKKQKPRAKLGTPQLPYRETEEDQADNRLLVEQIFKNETLTESEKALMQAKLNDPDASLRELAETCGYSNAMQVKRLFMSIREKVKYVID